MGTHYSHVTPADRMSIQALLQAKLNSTEIARKLGISRSTISREINRGKAKPTALAGDYQAAQVRHRLTALMRCRPIKVPQHQALAWV